MCAQLGSTIPATPSQYHLTTHHRGRGNAVGRGLGAGLGESPTNHVTAVDAGAEATPEGASVSVQA
jgi:hypothetical protein